MSDPALTEATLSDEEATAREIAQQPDVWAEVVDIVDAARPALDAFIGALSALPASRIVLTGAGTSAFIGDVLHAPLTRTTGARIDSVATTDIVANPQDVFAEDVPTLLVSFARSGLSPESVAATRLADQVLSDVRHLIITCDATGDLYRAHDGRADSLVLLMPRAANDVGFAMTSSFTSMLLAALLAFDPAVRTAVPAVARAARTLLSSRDAEFRALGRTPYERIVYLGSGPLQGLAREAALKTLELTAGSTVGMSNSTLGFRHGPKSALNDRTLIVVFVSSNPYTRRYDVDLLHELQATPGGHTVLAVTESPLPATVAYQWTLTEAAGLDDIVLTLAYVVVAQSIALNRSRALGLSTDNPFPSGEVNRVVQGVRIHPLTQQ